MKVKEMMTKEVVTVKPQDNAIEILKFLFKMKISGLPVVDHDGKLVGMFTEKDILTFILPSYLDKVGRFIYEENPKATKKKFLELNKMTISQLMRKAVVTTTEDTTLCEVAKDMLTRKARRVPVLDKEGRVVGLVARCDVLSALAKEAEIAINS